MKKLFIGWIGLLSVAFAIYGGGADIDQKCLRDCEQQGLPFAVCARLCVYQKKDSYNWRNLYNPCYLKCTSRGYSAGFCNQLCNDDDN